MHPTVALWFALCGTPDLTETDSVATVLSADPDAAVSRFVWRDSPHGTVSFRIPIIGSMSRAGFFLSAVPLIELTGTEVTGIEQVLPSLTWRGRAGFEAGWRWFEGSGAYAVWLAVEHESDHSTYPYPHLAHYRGQSFPFYCDVSSIFGGCSVNYSLQDLAVRAEFNLPIEALDLTLTTLFELRAYAGSCNVDLDHCPPVGSGIGFGPSAGIVADFGSGSSSGVYAALHMSELAGISHLDDERRLSLHLGFHTSKDDRGMFQFFALLFSGNDTGIDRGGQVEQVGLGVGWSP